MPPPSAGRARRRLTVGVLVGQPVVLGALELEVGVAQLALLGAEVLKVLGAVVGVAELVLVVHPRAVLAAVGRPEGGRRRRGSRQTRLPRGVATV